MAVRQKKSVVNFTTDIEQNVGEFLIIHGVVGIGKTEFACNFPKPVVIYDPHEHGVKDLKRSGKIKSSIPHAQVNTYEELMEALNQLKSEDACKTVVIDSYSGIEKLTEKYVLREVYNNNSEKFQAFSQGPKSTAREYVPLFVDMLTELRYLGKNVILICHSVTKTVTTASDVYEKWVPYADKDAWVVISKAAENIFFLSYDLIHQTERGKTSKRVTDTVNRFINTKLSGPFEAKSKYDIPPVIPMGDSGREAYLNYIKELKAAKAKLNEVPS